MRTSIKTKLDSLQLSDVYSLMLFLLYKVQDIPEYAVLSELCYLLDGSNILRLFTYFAGKTITFPSEEEFVILINALLLYQYVNIDGKSLAAAQEKLNIDGDQKVRDRCTDLYLKIVPLIKQYNINMENLRKNADWCSRK